jgi:NitT/TauT family transport system substrate-binding protein
MFHDGCGCQANPTLAMLLSITVRTYGANAISPRQPHGHARRRVISTALALLALSTLVTMAACKSERAVRQVTLGLSWIHQAQFSGPYYADRHGLYAKEGLAVQFVPATIDSDPLDEFIAGKYDFVIAQPDALIAARLKGHRLKAVAATYRIHPLVFLSLPSSGIVRPQDFRGKTIGVAYSEELILRALLKKMSIDASEVTIVKRPYDFDKLRNGDIQVQAGWVTDELQTARRADLALNVISPYDYGITFYADLLTVRESLIEKEPALVEKLVRATQHGWAAALQDPIASAKLPLHYNPALDPEHELQVLRATAPLVHTGVDQIGWMRAQEWEDMIGSLHEQGVIAERLPASDLFTTRFLEAALPQ